MRVAPTRQNRPAAFRPAALRPAAFRPAVLRPAALRPTALRLAAVRPTLIRRSASEEPAGSFVAVRPQVFNERKEDRARDAKAVAGLAALARAAHRSGPDRRPRGPGRPRARARRPPRPGRPHPCGLAASRET